MKFKTTLINSAVVAALGVAAGTAQAVNLASDGQGQVLIYPYYTAQTKGANPYDTYISVVNSDTARGKAVKVRFLEGKSSREVLDFNLYLSPNDMWTGTVTRDGSGNPILRTTDTSCTAPEIPVVSGTTREQPFVNFAYVTDAAADSTLARAKEGYVEIIQMGDLVSGMLTTGGLNTFAAAKHASGVPANCAGIRSAWLNNDFESPANDGIDAPVGTLSGALTIINPLEGTDISVDAVALERFRTSAGHFRPGSIQLQLNDVDPAESAVFQGSDLVLTDWTDETPVAVAVSAVLMRDQIINEFAIAAAPVGLSTDWVITFPTKHQHIVNATAAAKAPFTSTLGKDGACETVSLSTYNREEGEQTSGLIFSPEPPAGVNKLCWEANVVSLASGGTTSNALGGVNTRLTLGLPFSEGWLRMGFAQTRTAPVGATTRTNLYTGAVTSGLTSVYTGLPVVGFAASTFVNTSTLANYGGSYTHRYTRQITP